MEALNVFMHQNKDGANRIVVYRTSIVFLRWLSKVGKITTFCGTFSCPKYSVRDIIGRCCSFFLMAASTAAQNSE